MDRRGKILKATDQATIFLQAVTFKCRTAGWSGLLALAQKDQRRLQEVALGLSIDRYKNFSLQFILEPKSLRPMAVMNWRCELFLAVLLLEKPHDQHKTCMRVDATGDLVGGRR